MQNIIRFPTDQRLLFPVDMEEWLPEDDPVYAIRDTVAALDLHEFYQVYREDGMGGAFFDPAIMLGTLLYAYSRGEYSTRRIERACRYDVGFRVISRNLTPDHTTISRFIKRFSEQIPNIAHQITAILIETEVIRVGILAIDGTKVKASASLDANMNGKALADQLADAIRETMANDAHDDPVDADAVGINLIPASFRTRQQRREQLERAVARAKERQAERQAEETRAYEQQVQERAREEEETRTKKRGRKPQPPIAPDLSSVRVNLTDPDSAVMKGRRGFLQGYNGQILVNEDQFILACDVTNAQNDIDQLHPLLSQYLEVFGGSPLPKPTWVLGDAGYFSADVVVEAPPAWPDLLLATRKERGLPPDRTPNPTLLIVESLWKALRQDCLPCGSLLRAGARCVMDTMGWEEGTVVSPAAAVRKVMEALVRSPFGSTIYRRRKIMPEPVFGRLKENLRFRQFHHRGLAACRAEWALVCSTMNIMKAIGMGVQIQPLGCMKAQARHPIPA
jgi:transposase